MVERVRRRVALRKECPPVNRSEASHGSVVEIVGPAGVGKSTLVPMVSERVKRARGATGVVLLTPSSTSTVLARIARVAAYPRGAAVAVRIALMSSPNRLRALRRWAALIATMREARRAVSRHASVAIVEQAVVQFVRRPKQLGKLADWMLPDLVVEIRAHPAVVLRRRLDRDKLPRPQEFVRGDRRLPQAARLAWRIADVDADEAARLLERWSSTFCDPPLTTDELAVALAEGRSREEPEHPDYHWSGGVIRAAIRQRVDWIVVGNDEGASLDNVAETITSEVLGWLEVNGSPLR